MSIINNCDRLRIVQYFYLEMSENVFFAYENLA